MNDNHEQLTKKTIKEAIKGIDHVQSLLNMLKEDLKIKTSSEPDIQLLTLLATCEEIMGFFDQDNLNIIVKNKVDAVLSKEQQ